jgi:hypothetical protein
VDHIEGDQIKLTRNDPQAQGRHHYIPADWIDRVEGEEVRLRHSASEARAQWRVAD